MKLETKANPTPPPPKLVIVPEEPLRSSEEKKVPKEYKVPEDLSLTVKEYVQRGCPTPNKPWSLSDMFQARTAFTSKPLLAGIKPPPLPRWESKRSGELFARFTSPQNIERIRNPGIPLKARLDYASAYSTNFASFYELFAIAFIQRDVGDSEMVEIIGHYIYVSAEWKQVLDESLKKSPRGEKADQADVESMAKAKQGWGILLGLALSAIEDTQNYRPEERLKMVNHMRKTLPILAPALTADTRIELLRRVSEYSKNPDQKTLHDGLAELHKILE